MNIDEAQDIAMRTLVEYTEKDKYMILGDRTKEFDIGWTFFAERKEFIETGNPLLQGPGVGWIFVDRETGAAELLSSAISTERSVDEIRTKKLE